MTPYVTVWIALFSWPVVAVVFYHLWNLPTATAATLIVGYLLLPHGMAVDLPGLPPLDKDVIPAISALVLVWSASGKRQHAQHLLPGWLPRDKVACILIGLWFLGAFATTLTNTDPVQNGATRLPGMRLYDGFSMALSVITTLIPFLLARKVMASSEGQRTLAFFIVGAAVAYAFLALFEIRMSPRTNAIVYGYFPHSWIQHIRDGGFRPLVFLAHGLVLGIFFASAIIIAFGLAKAEASQQRAKLYAAGIWLLFTILLSKVLGAFLITMSILPLVFFTSRRIQLIVATGLSVIVLMYPVLRAVDLIPTQTAIKLAEHASPERAQSLDFRIKNEDILLKRARERPLFGWGGYGRNRVLDENGKDISVTDGYWLILFGQGGWCRYIGVFGLLVWGIVRLGFQPRDKIDPITVTLAMALVANLIDLLPNGGVSPITWMMTGALVGRGEMRGIVPQQIREVASAGRRSIRYAREPNAREPSAPVPVRDSTPAYQRDSEERVARSDPPNRLRRKTNG